MRGQERQVGIGDIGVHDVAQRAAVESELARILDSAHFKSSKRSARLLSYVVSETLEGRAGELKERTLGIKLFDKPSDYRTDEDASVRVAAGEVRKRLAQFYLESGTEVVRIDLPAGSYVPTFQFVAEPTPPGQPKPRRRWLLMAGMAVLLGAFVLSVFSLRPTRVPDPVAEFWAPVLASKTKVLIALGEVRAYDLVGPALKDYESLYGTGCPDDDPRCRMRIRGLERIRAGVIPTGDAASLLGLVEFFLQRGLSYQVKWVSETHFSELRGQPTVLIGAGMNRWAEVMRGQIRYEIGTIPGSGFGVMDTRNPGKVFWRLTSPWPKLEDKVDYGIISRWRDPGTGAVMVCLAGVAPPGTHAAGALATDPKLLRGALAGKEVDFSKPRVEMVFEVKVVDGSFWQPRVLATHAE